MVSKKKPRVMYFPTLDFLTPYQQEKKLKELASEVKVYNMYDDINKIPSVVELLRMDKSSAKNIVEQAKIKHAQKDLLEHWGITRHYLYTHVYETLGVETNSYVRQRKKNIKKESETSKLVITTQGRFEGSEAQERLITLAEVLNTDNEYDIEVTIKEA